MFDLDSRGEVLCVMVEDGGWRQHADLSCGPHKMLISILQIRWTTRSCVALLSTALCSAQSSGPRLMRSDAPIEWQRFGGCRHRWTAARSDSKNERHGMEFLYEFGDVDVLIVEMGFQRFQFFFLGKILKNLGNNIENHLIFS